MSDDDTRFWSPDEEDGPSRLEPDEDATQIHRPIGGEDPTPTPAGGYFIPAPDSPAEYGDAEPRYEEPRRSGNGLLIAILVVLLLVVAVILARLALGSDDGDGSPTETTEMTTVPETTSSEPEVTTSEAPVPTTEAPPETVAPTAPPTTAPPPTTLVPPTTVAPPTTETPPATDPPPTTEPSPEDPGA